MTTDQLSYILERKYVGVIPGYDYILSESVNRDPETGKLEHAGDAQIRDWFLQDIPQPTEEQLQQLWEKLKEEYHGRPDREDSVMAQYIASRNQRKVTINEEL